MKLLTKEILNRLPKLYSGEDIPLEDKVVQVKFFNPVGAGTWYGVEYDPKTKIFFGYVSIFGDYNDEWGDFSLTELENYRGKFGLGIERDMSFTPEKFKDTKLGKDLKWQQKNHTKETQKENIF